jgi:hypothetical protein
MKHKTSLFLMELLIMILVLALAAAGCLRCFAWASQSIRETALRDQALILAQNTAEALKSTGGNIPAARTWVRVSPDLELDILPLSPAVSGLGEAQITIYHSQGEKLFSLVVAWQEVPG